MKQGFLIALEGIDGAGTTTQIAPLERLLRRRGWDVRTTAEPSDHNIGRLVRAALSGKEDLAEESLALLFAADRIEHLRGEIAPAIAAGGVVVSDRYVLSSMAYQSSSLPAAWVADLNKHASAAALTLFFRVSPETAAQRRQQRATQREHFDDLNRQRRIAALYEEVVLHPWAGELHVIDAEQGVDDVTRQIEQALELFLLRQKDSTRRSNRG